MNGPQNPSWSAPEQFDPMAGVAEHDFTSFLDLGEIDLDFPTFEQNGSTNVEESDPQLKGLASSLEMQHLPPSGEIRGFQEDMSANAQAHHSQSMVQQGNLQEQGNAYMNFTLSHFGQQQFSPSQSHLYQNFRGVPPTPNSVEMHGDTARYLQQVESQSHIADQQQYNVRKGDVASFTPLVSPAVTPHDARFRVPPEFAVPGSYMSPLTSPALEGQVPQSAQYSQSNSQASGSSEPSPINVDIDMQASGSQPGSNRKKKSKKPAPPRSSGPLAKVQQSPIAKPQRRKARLSGVIPSKDVTEIQEALQQSNSNYSRPGSSGDLMAVQSRETSEADSISPEPLTESVMGPPPRPGSVSQSPSIMARGSNTSAPAGSAVQGMPATPASLMRLQSPNFAVNSISPNMHGNTRHSQQPGAPPMLEELTLPEAADTSILDDVTTPRISARKTPKLGPLSSPSAAMALSGKQSPAMGPMASPTTMSSPAAAKRLDQRGGRGAKKRASTSSTLVSPALRPKISPSIKPLLPDGGMSDEKHALLLATKSNYQNILEGTHVPGVTYPEALTTNLTSKRTSHKIAEQGRRNRINTALQEMQSLLPSPTVTAKTPKALNPVDAQNGDPKSPGEIGSDGGGGSNSKAAAAAAAAQGSSKAATVEQAIEFIKQLKKEAGEREKLIESRDKEVEELRKKLSEMERRLAQSSRSNSIVSDDRMMEDQESETEQQEKERRKEPEPGGKTGRGIKAEAVE